jgi:nitrilase
VQLEGTEVARLISASAAHDIFVVVGMVERFGSTLYCTALMIDPVAGLAEIHRKLMPTGTERLIWGFGDGSTIGTAQSRAGRVGTVICWFKLRIDTRRRSPVVFSDSGSTPNPTGRIANADER